MFPAFYFHRFLIWCIPDQHIKYQCKVGRQVSLFSSEYKFNIKNFFLISGEKGGQTLAELINSLTTLFQALAPVQRNIFLHPGFKFALYCYYASCLHICWDTIVPLLRSLLECILGSEAVSIPYLLNFSFFQEVLLRQN